MPSRAVRTAAVAVAVGVFAVVAARSTGPAQPAAFKADPVPAFGPAEAHRPTPIPDRVILTWKDDPATSQAVTWRTDTSVKEPVAQLALADNSSGVEPGWKGYDPKKITVVPAATTPLTTNLGDALYHRVNFVGLRPKTKYMYRVGGGAHWSEWFHFETAADRPEPFGFIYFGDAQNGIKSLWSRVARGAYSDMPKAKFIVHAGDLVDNGAADEQWGEWHTAAGWVNGMVPSVPSPGNHEYLGQTGLTTHWRAQFTLPENGPPGLDGTCYTFDYQGVRVISLNTEEKINEQVAWLDAVLANNPNRWTVVTFHRPIYASGAGRDNPHVRQAWRPVFDKYGVDLVLQGHDHNYARSGLMREDNVLTGAHLHPLKGTVYVVSVSGAKLYNVTDLPWAQRSGQDVQLYQLIRIDGDRLKYESRTATGELYDSFELRKRAGVGSELVETGGGQPTTVAGRQYGNAAAAAVILAVIAVGIGWALRRR